MFRDTAAPSLDQSYAEAVNGMLVSSMTGPCCYAVATRQTIVVPEVAADSRFSGFRAFADPLRVRSCWSTLRAKLLLSGVTPLTGARSGGAGAVCYCTAATDNVWF
jgi:hypothetical protein